MEWESSGVGMQWSGNAVEWECSGVNAFMQWMQLGDPHNDLSPSSRCTVDAVDTVGGHSGCNEYSGCSGHRNAVDNVDTGDAVDTVGGHSACSGCSGHSGHSGCSLWSGCSGCCRHSGWEQSMQWMLDTVDTGMQWTM